MAKEIIVLGCGMAGVSAALYARERGAKVKIIAEGFAGSAMSSGSFVDREPDGSPYGTLDEEKINFLGKILPGFAFAAGGAQIANAFGTLAPVKVVAPWHKNAVITRDGGAKKILLVGLYELPAFWPAFAAKNFNANIGVAARFEGVSLPQLPLDDPTVYELADWLDSDAGLEQFAKLLNAIERVNLYDAVLLPPVIGRKAATLGRLADSTGLPLSEFWAPWGVAGERMNKKLLDEAAAAGIEFVRAKIEGIEIASGAVKQINLNGAPHAEVPAGAAVIVAIGGALLAGKDLGVEHYRPPVNLPWAMTEDEWITKDPSRLFATTVDGRDPGLTIGVEVDESMRIKDKFGAIWAGNAFAAGDAIGGRGPGSGGLLRAFATGIEAALRALTV